MGRRDGFVAEFVIKRLQHFVITGKKGSRTHLVNE